MTLLDKEHVEYNNEGRARLILKGQWLYDNIKPLPIQIFAINYDYYYEIDKEDDRLAQGDEPELNKKGEQYLLAWHGDKCFSWAGSTTYGGLTLEEAKEAAQNMVQNRIIWDEPFTTDYL